MVNYHGREWSLWYKAETTEGTAPTATQYLALAQMAEIRINNQTNPNAVALSGSVDFSEYKKGVNNIVFSLSFNPSSANGTAFIKNFASSDTSFTLIAKAGTIFQVFKGCKLKTTSVEVSIYPDGTPLSVSCDVMAWNFTTSEPSTITYEAIPSTFVNWSDVVLKLDAGATASTTITDWWNCSFSIENDLFRIPASDGTTSAIHRGRRKGIVSITRQLTDTASTEMTASTNATAYSSSIAFGSSTFTFTNGAFTDVEITHSITGMSGKKTDIQASTITIV